LTIPSITQKGVNGLRWNVSTVRYACIALYRNGRKFAQPTEYEKTSFDANPGGVAPISTTQFSCQSSFVALLFGLSAYLLFCLWRCFWANKTI